MPFPAIPPLLMWVGGTLGAVLLARFARREYQRVNAEMTEIRARTDDPVAARPTLRRDPRTGIYRPD